MQRDGICTRGFQVVLCLANLLDFFDATLIRKARSRRLYGRMQGRMYSNQSGPNSNTEKGVDRPPKRRASVCIAA